MYLRRIVIACCIFTICQQSFSQERFIARIQFNNDTNLENEIIKRDLDITRYEKDEFIDLLLTTDQFTSLQKQNFSPIIRTTEKDLRYNLSKGLRLEGYHTYEEIKTIFQNYVANYPDICTMHDIGNSLGKDYFELGYTAYEDFQHDIWALKISDNPEIEEDEPSLLFDGVHHAREIIGAEVVLNLADYLIINYGTDPDVTAGINNNQIWIVPIVNPDGHKIVTDSTEIWWRKNLRDNNGNFQIDPFLPDWIERDGVDINRNYGSYWGGDWNTAPWFRETYNGPYSFSENCSKNLAKLMDDHHFVTEMTYHSYGELFYYPWGHNPTESQTPDHQLYSSLASELANMTPKLSGGHYTPRLSGSVFTVTGGTIDYAYGQHGIFAFLVELAEDFIPEPSDIEPVCAANLNAQLHLLDRVQHSMLTGHITDATSGDPMVATIFIEGIDNNPNGRVDYKSDSLFGRYYRLLKPDDYDVTFSAFGYEPQTFSDVNINSNGLTVLDVEMQSAESFEISGIVLNMQGSPVENAQVVILNTPVDTVYTDESGIFWVNNFYEGTYQFEVSSDHYFSVKDSLFIDDAKNMLLFELSEYEKLDFENEEDMQQFKMFGQQYWFRTNDESFEGDYSLVSPVLSLNQISTTSVRLHFVTDVIMSFSTKVSLDSLTQGMMFIMDEQTMKTYCWENDWNSDTFFIPQGTHNFRWSLSRDFKYPASGFQNKCWIDEVVFHNLTTGISESIPKSEPSFVCYPNPASDIITIMTDPALINRELKIIDLAGRIVLSAKINQIAKTFEISHLPSGTYIIQAGDPHSHSLKLIKK